MISFVIPVYNKEKILFKTLKKLLSVLSKKKLTDFEIILVNDGSTDKSLDEAVKFKKFGGVSDKISIYHYKKNIGKGNALKYGFYQTSGETIVFLDGDMDIDPKYITQALNKFARTKADMVIGSKYHPLSRTKYPLSRFVYSKILKSLTWILFRLSVTDTQVGLKVFRRKVLEQVMPKLVIKRFATDLEILAVARKLGFTKIKEIPVVIDMKYIRYSSVNKTAVLHFLIDMVAIFYRRHILNYYEDYHTDVSLSSSPLPVTAEG